MSATHRALRTPPKVAHTVHCSPFTAFMSEHPTSGDHDFPSPGHPLPPAGSADSHRAPRTEFMTREEQIKTMIANVMRQFSSQLRGHRVLLFGSRAGGKARQRSDFDIGVIGNEPLPVKVFYEIDDMLENLPTLYRIDWVDLNNAAPSLRERALENAEVIYE